MKSKDDSGKKLSGGAYMTSKGEKPILLGATEEEHALIREAAKVERQSMKAFCMMAAMERARRVLKKAK